MALSHRVRLAAQYAFLLTALEAAIVAGVSLVRRQSELDAFDARLLRVAHGAAQEIVRGPGRDGGRVARDAAAAAQDVFYVEVADPDGTVFARSSETLAATLDLPAPRGLGEVRFEDVAMPDAAQRLDAAPLARLVALPFRDDRGRLHVVRVVSRTTGARHLVDDLAARLEWLVPLNLLAAFVVTSMLGRRALRPVAAVAEAAATVTPGTLRRPIDVAGAEGEVAQLQAALNDALRRLDRAFDAQSRFAADASHELKTPISVLLTQAQVLDARTAPRPALAAFVASVEAEMRRLGRTVESLLLLARAESDASPPRADPTPLADVVLEAVRRAEPLARQHAVRIVPRIDVAPDAEAPVVAGDPDLLGTLVDNLLTNAVRFSPAGAVVDVGVSAAAGAALVVVRDRGPGIPEGYETRIFDRFVQTPAGAGRGGSGIGLDIAARIAERHGGTIAARNAPGGGCELTVTLPPAGQRDQTRPNGDGRRSPTVVP